MVVMVTGPSFNNISWGTYIGTLDVPLCVMGLTPVAVFAALNAFIVPIVYLFFPETAGRSLEGASA